MVSQAERDIRWEKLKQRMDQEGLNGIVILGSGAFGPKENGHYRFYVDNRVYYYIQAMVLGADGEPVIICGSQTHLDVLRSRNFRDIRMVGDRIAEGIADALVSKSITEGTVGICADQLPASWYRFLTERLPDIRLRDVSEALYALRCSGDGERERLTRQAAALARMGYDAACGSLQGDASVAVLRAEMEYAMKKNGAEEVLTLLSVPGEDGHAALPSGIPGGTIPTDSKLYMIAAPRYEGYWAPICRTILTGEADQTDEFLHRIALDALKAGAAKLTPGTQVREIAGEMKRCLRRYGCRGGASFGNVCGVDVFELDISEDSQEVLSESMTVFLRTEAMSDSMNSGICWGETYLVTRQGGVRLCEGSSELREVKRDGPGSHK